MAQMRPPVISRTWMPSGSSESVGPVGRYTARAGHPLAATTTTRSRPFSASKAVRNLRMSGGAVEPQLERRHAEDRILVQKRHERVDVVAFEGPDVAIQQLPVRFRRLCRRGIEVCPRQGTAGPTSRASDGALAGLKELGYLVRLPAPHVAKDEDCALARRQVLEGGDDGQPDRLLGHNHVDGVRIGG